MNSLPLAVITHCPGTRRRVSSFDRLPSAAASAGRWVPQTGWAEPLRQKGHEGRARCSAGTQPTPGPQGEMSCEQPQPSRAGGAEQGPVPTGMARGCRIPCPAEGRLPGSSQQRGRAGMGTCRHAARLSSKCPQTPQLPQPGPRILSSELPLAQTCTPRHVSAAPKPCGLTSGSLDLSLPPAPSPSCSLTHRDTLKHLLVDPQTPWWAW